MMRKTVVRVSDRAANYNTTNRIMEKKEDNVMGKDGNNYQLTAQKKP